MRLQKTHLTILGLVLFVLTLSAVVTTAQVPGPRPNVFDNGNRWLITYYNDCDVQHSQWATQGICFLPYRPCGACGINGAWYSDTFPNWLGRYTQEGDRILMHGNWANFRGSDGMFIDLFAGTSPRDEGAGQWTEWWNFGAPFGTTVGFGNTRLRRVGKCELPHNNHLAQMDNNQIDRLAEELSRKVRPRMRKDGKPAESPTDPEQVPLKEEAKYER